MQQVTKTLLAYFDGNKRDLPWRQTKDPYRIWISEIMLQQTRVEAVKGYYERFLQAFPTMNILARASEDEVNKVWQGLGYYSRARNLQATAKLCIMNYDGKLPSSYDDLIRLPGIGSYTAGAILSIAYNQRISAVDGNAMRLFSRLLEIDDNILKETTKKKFIELITPYVDSLRPGDFNQAIMDFANDICLPTGYKCAICPLNSICLSYQHDTQSKYPNREKKNKKRCEDKTIVIVQCGKYYRIHKRNSEGLLAGLYEFNTYDSYLIKEEIEKKFEKIESIEYLGEAKHIFSHVIWNMRVWHIQVRTMDSTLWCTKKELQDVYSIPTAYMKAFQLIKP